MAQRREVTAIYAAGVVQGLALVTFPAASTIFTSPDYYGLTATAYGAMFVPQAILAILASLLGASLTRRMGIKRIYLIGLGANLLSMALLFISQLLMSNQTAAYLVLLLATTCLGLGFGLTVPSLNTLTAAAFPTRIDSAVLILNALLGLGTVLAPVFVGIFIGLGIWWGLPLLAGALLLVLIVYSLPLKLEAEGLSGTTASAGGSRRIPSRFWIFAGFALLYGIVETMNGNWASLYMTDLGAPATTASMALTLFWGMVTVGRLLFAAIARRVPNRSTYHVLPFLVALSFVILALLPQGSITAALAAFALAGLGCSALLPLTISFGQEELAVIAAAVAGYLIAFYQMGYGLAAFGVGPLEDYAGITLSGVYGLAAVVAVALAALSFVVVRRHAPGGSATPESLKN